MATMGFTKKDAKEFAVEIVHESGVIADVWELQPSRHAAANQRNCYLVLRDGNNTEITDRQAWRDYKNAHPEARRHQPTQQLT